MKGLFVTGSDTDVGKTTLSCLLIEALRTRYPRVGAYKPAATGVVELIDSDIHRLWEATGKLHSIGQVCQHIFIQPIAPLLAAACEGKELADDRLISGGLAWKDYCDCLVIEGAGGLLSPMTATSTNADLAAKFGFPVVLVIAHKIGAVNQCMLTFEAAVARGLRIAAMILVESMPQPAYIRFADHIAMIRKELTQAHRDGLAIVPVAYGQKSLMEKNGSMPGWIDEAFGEMQVGTNERNENQKTTTET